MTLTVAPSISIFPLGYYRFTVFVQDVQVFTLLATINIMRLLILIEIPEKNYGS